jgi:hypothetical protein
VADAAEVDLKLPGVDGFETVESLLNHYRGAGIPSQPPGAPSGIELGGVP